ncbi:MAG TPA: PH domain-containing protein [Clostridia bacterium]|nr:PH domain-containing protein [Clostridia bacterium]
MNFLSAILAVDEKIVIRTKIHWFIFFRPLAAGLFSLIALSLGETYLFLAVIILFWAFFWLLKALFYYLTAELILTNQRVLLIFRFFNRLSAELFFSEIKEVKVEQEAMGRILDFGTIRIIQNVGKEKVWAEFKKPAEFSKYLQKQLSKM